MNPRLSALSLARIQRNPTPVVLSRDSLFMGVYVTQFSDLHPDGDRLVVLQNVSGPTNAGGVASGSERFVLVTNWFTELRQRMGSN